MCVYIYIYMYTHVHTYYIHIHILVTAQKCVAKCMAATCNVYMVVVATWWLWQNVATCAHLKHGQNVGNLWPFCENPVCPDTVRKPVNDAHSSGVGRIFATNILSALRSDVVTGAAHARICGQCHELKPLTVRVHAGVCEQKHSFYASLGHAIQRKKPLSSS